MEKVETIHGELRTANLTTNGTPKEVEKPRLVKGNESEALDGAAAALESGLCDPGPEAPHCRPPQHPPPVEYVSS